tara:strand:- start:388 stop:633 length:246 start_codon:yes stop_codon:yes gene_type:complete
MNIASTLGYIGYLFLVSLVIWTLVHGAFGPVQFIYNNPNKKYHDKPRWFKVVETITFSGISIIFIGFWMMVFWAIIERALG